MTQIHKRFLFKLPDGTKVVEVIGPQVRRHHVDYVEGGHGYIYPWIPRDVIWAEKMLNRQDECCNAVHKIREQRKMKYHGWSYDRAHDHANRVESRLRRAGPGACCRALRALAKGGRLPR